jgi:uncharacterized membrane protein YoaK (UPF0700 family)
MSRLPLLLSIIAGMVDVLGYFSLGNLFTAHVTGNIVVIAATLVRGGAINTPQVLAVPVFIVAIGVVWLVAKLSDWRGQQLLRPLLIGQLLLLAGALVVAVAFHVVTNPNGSMTSVAAVIATSAMACQFAMIRMAVPGAPSAAVMTGNLTYTVLSVLEKFSSRPTLIPRDDERLVRTATLVAGFSVGCVAAGAAVPVLGDWAWSLPVALGLAAAMSPKPARAVMAP